MNYQQGRKAAGQSKSSEESFVSAPAISLPKGGGAIRGIGEKFAANPVTGTGSMTVPIATSPGRSGFGPQLALSYDSSAGNGPFGFGWSLSLPSITRRTDKGLPQYRDAEESDVFILSGAEDLVPVLEQDAQGNWKPETLPPRMLDGKQYRIRRYRPRIEGLVARIERWTNETDPRDVHWRSISRDNITTWYGKTSESRIADPTDPTRIFSWLICESYDDKGNAIVYEYKREDSQRIFEDPHGQFVALAHERNRSETSHSSNRYLKRIKYGNRTPNRDATTWEAADPAQLPNETWMFDVVFDYGEGHYTDLPLNPARPEAEQHRFVLAQAGAASLWPVRQDPFSAYRAGFEVRTYRLCRRVLLFHHFPQELGINDCLVRSTEFSYSESPIASFITGVTQSGYVRKPIQNQPNRYLIKSLPSLEFDYSRVPSPEELARQPIRDVDAESLENLPVGLDGASYQWVDLDGEGTSGILTEQAGGWYYKRNLSANNQLREEGHERTVARFGPAELVASKPAVGLAGGAQFLDLAGDGQVDLVQTETSVRGFYEHTDDATWAPFQPFVSWPDLDTRDPDLKFVDLTGDGHADILITEGDVLTWYPSLGEDGFGPAVRVSLPSDEEKGPRLVFSDGIQSIYLADLSGDGLSDMVRIRNGEACYWPNLGYGRFGAKVTMDNAPWFDSHDQFDQGRIRLVDTDGSGTTDILYLRRDGVQIYYNQSGNGWSDRVALPQFPPSDNISSVQALDLLGNGTACLVWSSPLPGAARQPMRYLALMEEKPHLLVGVKNNLGAEIKVHYAPSTKFHLADKAAGKPWIPRLPFPVHVVERLETYDRISRNRFVTRYAYHHGYFDGEEREFRGFGMVEQFDTEELGVLTESGNFPNAVNIDAASYVPTVRTKTWFHTGFYVGRDHVSNFFAGLLDEKDIGEYYREPGLTDAQARQLLLDDTVLPDELTAEEEREACRALKGTMLRQEVYALDGTEKEKHPYTVTEQNFTIRRVQPQAGNRHAVFFTHAREAISYHYERNPADPRIQHALTLEVDEFGNVLKSAAVGYGRRERIRVVDEQGEITGVPNPDLIKLDPRDQKKQIQMLITYTENRVTNAISDVAAHPDDYRTPLPCEARTYELTGYKPGNNAARFSFDEWTRNDFGLLASATEIPYEQTADHISKQKRLIEHVRTLYRKDDLTALLPLGEVKPLALPGESYKLAFTPGLLAQVFQRNGQPLLPNTADVLSGQGADRGGYLQSQLFKASGLFPNTDPDDHWWIPSGKVFFDVDADIGNPPATAPQELAESRAHFFLPRKFVDPFDQSATVDYDVPNNLTMVMTQDALGNRVTAQNDYRVLAPRLLTGPNGNCSEIAFDTLGLVVGTAVMGKEGENLGDTLNDFKTDLIQDDIDGFCDVDDPHQPAPGLLKGATTRIVYDLDRFRRLGEPPFAATLARETHASEPLPPQGLKIQISFSYSDGFGREIQKKIQAEPGPVVEGGPLVDPRWVVSGWTVFNNIGKSVRQYEPFFDDTHDFKFGNKVGVSPILFYDPVGRVVATLHPNHTYEKVVFDPWQQTTYDVNDTVTFEPKTDKDVKEFFTRLPDEDYLPTWNQLRTDLSFLSAFAERYPDATDRANETRAAQKAAAHADTPSTAHFDSLGRPFLTVARNRVVCADHPLNGKPDEEFRTRVELDIEGNQRKVLDERKLPDAANLPLGVLEQRVVMEYAYDMLGNRIYQLSMEAGARWMLNDVAGKPIRAWDSRGHNFTKEYDALRRPVEQTIRGTTAESDPRTLNRDILVDKIEYGEPPPNATPAQEAEAQRLNLRTRIYRHLDSSGIATNAWLDAAGDPLEAYDFKGNLLRSTRRLALDNKGVPDWSQPPEPQLEAELFEACTRYDALNRPIQSIAPHSNLTRPEHPNKFNIIQPIFNEANLLERVDVWLERAAEPTSLLDPAIDAPSPVGVADIDYDAKGQRTLIDYKTRDATVIRTTYTYDRETFRLTHLYTRRGVNPQTAQGVAFTEDCDNPTPPPPTIAAPEQPPAVKGCGLQNLHYTYDPAGNITHIRDDAQQTIYFKNKRVEPSNDYTYDALYRLIQAGGREHLGQVGGTPIPHSYNDAPRVGIVNPGTANRYNPCDGNVMGTYRERYVYDAVGNFLQMQHRGTDPAHPGWTRRYTHSEPSLIEAGKQSNRLTSTQVGNGITAAPETYLHDAHGNMLRMPHLPTMEWDFKDELHVVDLGGGGTAYYMYDAGGQRVRKVIEKNAGTLIEERLYLGGFEVYRKRQNGAVALERETLHIMEDKQRIALVETKTIDNQSPIPNPQPLIRYQFSNHLGSASLELDDAGQIISYEEYYPYGSTSYQAGRSIAEVSLKRYRYSGKERDEESGFIYLDARYFIPWLGRFGSVDPDFGKYPQWSTYCYAFTSPLMFTDPSGKGPDPHDILEVNIRAINSLSEEGVAASKELEEFKTKAAPTIAAGHEASSKVPLVEKRKYLSPAEKAEQKALMNTMNEGKKAEKQLRALEKKLKDIGRRLKGAQEYLNTRARSLLHSGPTSRASWDRAKGLAADIDAARQNIAGATGKIEGHLGTELKPKKWTQMKAPELPRMKALPAPPPGKGGGGGEGGGGGASGRRSGPSSRWGGRLRTAGTVAMGALEIGAVISDLQMARETINYLEKHSKNLEEQQRRMADLAIADWPSEPSTPEEAEAHRRQFVQSIMMWGAAVALATSPQANAPAPVEESTTETQSGTGGSEFTPVNPFCSFWTPTGIPFNVPGPCF